MPYRDPAKARAHYARYREENRERLRDAHKRWRDEHPEALAAIRERGRETQARVFGAWLERNRERYNLTQRRAKARRRSICDADAAGEYVEVLLGDPCSYCGAPAEQVDHIDSTAVGGSAEWVNFTAACGPCNRRKSTRPLLTFLLAGLR